MPLPRAEMDAALKATFVPGLRAAGFKGSYPHFSRQGRKWLEVVGVQFSQWGGQFYIEIGLCPKGDMTLFDGTVVPQKKLKHYHAGQRERVGAIPFDYEANQVQTVATMAAGTLDTIELWFRDREV